MPNAIILTLPGPPIARSEPTIGRRGTRSIMFDSTKTRVGKHSWLAVWLEAGQPRLPDAPLTLNLTIFCDRPQGHYRKDHSLSAAGLRTPYPTTKPDVSNVIKIIEDALKGRAFRDDSQIIGINAIKRYGQARTVVTIRVIDPSDPSDPFGLLAYTSRPDDAGMLESSHHEGGQ